MARGLLCKGLHRTAIHRHLAPNVYEGVEIQKLRENARIRSRGLSPRAPARHQAAQADLFYHLSAAAVSAPRHDNHRGSPNGKTNEELIIAISVAQYHRIVFAIDELSMHRSGADTIPIAIKATFGY